MATHLMAAISYIIVVDFFSVPTIYSIGYAFFLEISFKITTLV